MAVRAVWSRLTRALRVCQCEERFEAQVLAQRLPHDEFAAFLRMKESALKLELDAEYDAKLKRELAEAERGKDIAAHRRHIVENLLVLRCPRCAQAFVDFQGCFALRCNRCNAAFCGWCLIDCGNDAHPHVRLCRLNAAANNVYGTAEQFEQCQRARRQTAVRAYLAALPANIKRAALVAACASDFRDLGLKL